MKNKKWFALIFFGLLLITTFQIINPVNAEENPSGYIIIGNKVIWNTSNGYLEVYPHTSNNAITQIQYCNFTWKKSDTDIDMAFIFTNKLLGNKDVFIWKNISHIIKVPIYQNTTAYYELYSISNFKQLNITPQYVDYGDIPSLKYYTGKIPFQNGSYKNLTIGFDSMRWLNTQHTNGNFTYHYLKVIGYSDVESFYFDWDSIKDKFNYTMYFGKHYYYYKDISIIHNKLYCLKWVYDIPFNTDGKWELLLKLSSDTLSESYSTGRYVLIDPWYNSYWKYCKKITIDHTKISATLTNFPILFDNTSSSFSNAQIDGDDFIFIAEGNVTKYNHEIESFSGNRLISWVNVTSISSTVDTVLWLYYNNALCSNQQNPSGVWNAGYKLILHMNGTTTIHDSTSNIHDGTATSDESVGFIGKAQSFTKTAPDRITIGDNNDFSFGDSISDTPFTWSCWIKPSYTEGSDTRYFSILSKFSTSNWEYQFYYTTKISVFHRFDVLICDASNNKYQLVSYSYYPSMTKYNFVTVTYNANKFASGLNYYINGTKVSRVCTNMSGYVAMENKLAVFEIGSINNNDFYNGLIDELHISNVERNVSWISTEYNNQYSPSTFLSVGMQRFNPFLFIVSEIYPLQNSTDIPLHQVLSIHIHNLFGDRINVSFWLLNDGDDKYFLSSIERTTYDDPVKGAFCNVTFYSTSDSNGWSTNQLNKKYHWFINVSDCHGNSMEFPNSSALLYDGKLCYDFTTEIEQSYLVNNGSSVWIYLGAMLTLDNGQFFLLILIGLWSYFIYLFYKEKEVIFSFCIICCGLPLGIILSGVAYYNSYPFGYLISFIIILISFLIPTYATYQKNKKKK